jgi:TolB protein
MTPIRHTRAAVLLVVAIGLAATSFAPTAAAQSPSSVLDPRSLRGTIAFVCEVDDGANDELCLMDADGARRTQITDNAGPDRAPTWSPDGRQIVFNSRRDPHADRPQIYVHDLAAGAATRVSDGPVEDQRASWTPDGRSVVFQRGTFAAGYELYRQGISDGTLTKLTNTPGKINAAGSFAPDGTRLTLQSNREAAGLFPFATYVIDRVSGTTTRIGAEVTASHDGPR